MIIRNSPLGTGVYDDTTGIARLTKDVTIVQVGEDFILYAQDLTYNKPKNQAVATGSLRVETRDSTVRGERIFADFNKKVITITGNVVITTHGKGDGITGTGRGFKAEYARKPSKILCSRADWDYEAREAVLTGNLRMTQGPNSGTCDRIIYDEEQNIAQLIGRVRFRNEDNQVFNTPDLTIYIDEGRISTKRAVMQFGPRPGTPATTRPAKKTPKFGPAPKISDEQIKQFDITPAPIPTPRPEPTEVPEIVVSEVEAPEPVPAAE
jgi:lipopolysaccharide export system protein LptA